MGRVDTDMHSNIVGYLTAAERGDPTALFELGLIYATGNGTDRDLVQAHKWFNLAAMKGSDAAKEERAELADELSAAEIAEAQRAARQWISGQARA